MEGIKKRDPVSLLQLVAEAVNAGTDLIQWAFSFLSFLRNLLVAKVGGGPLGFEDLGAESVQRLSDFARQFSLEELVGVAQVLTGVIETMRRVGEPRIPLEMVLVRLSLGESMVAVAELVDRLERLQGQLTGNPPSTALPSAKQNVPSPTPSSSASSIRLENVLAVWPRFLDQIHEQKASVSAYLNEACPIAIEENDPPQIVVGLLKGFEFHREALDRPPIHRLIEQTFGTLLGSSIRCTFRIVEKLPDRSSVKETASPPPPISESAPPQDPSFLNSVADLFQGRVIGERG